jgi:hypothetical protein
LAEFVWSRFYSLYCPIITIVIDRPSSLIHRVDTGTGKAIHCSVLTPSVIRLPHPLSHFIHSSFLFSILSQSICFFNFAFFNFTPLFSIKFLMRLNKTHKFILLRNFSFWNLNLLLDLRFLTVIWLLYWILNLRFKLLSSPCSVNCFNVQNRSTY